MVSYSYPVIIIVLIFAGVIMAAFAVPINYMTESLNDGVDDGVISDQTQHRYNWAVGMFKIILPLSIIGICVYWGITQANIGGE